MSVEPDEAVVLHARPWRETSQWLELLTRTGGRQGALLKGGRRQDRHGAHAALQPFVHYGVTFVGRGELRTIRSAEPHARYDLAGNHLYAGLYLNELLLLVTHRQAPATPLFDGLLVTYRLLADGLPLEPVLRSFELALLDELGVGLDLDADAQGEPLDARFDYVDVPDRGLYRLITGNPPAESTGIVFSGADLQALSQRDFGGETVVRAARRLLRPRIDLLLDGRRLRTRELMRQQLMPPSVGGKGRGDDAEARREDTPEDGS